MTANIGLKELIVGIKKLCPSNTIIISFILIRVVNNVELRHS
jgi:hypothetical protein